MFIGGASGSIAGGIKVSTIFLIVIAIVKGTDSSGSIKLANHRFKTESVANALIFTLRAFILLFFFVFLLKFSMSYYFSLIL